MDDEGRDIDFIIPGPWAYAAPALAPHLTQGLYRAYHRYMADYCSLAPDLRISLAGVGRRYSLIVRSTSGFHVAVSARRRT